MIAKACIVFNMSVCVSVSVSRINQFTLRMDGNNIRLFKQKQKKHNKTKSQT